MTTEHKRGKYGKRAGRMLLLGVATMVSSMLGAQWVHARVLARMDQRVLQLSRTFDELLQASSLPSLPTAEDAPGNSFVVQFNGIQIHAATRSLTATQSELGALFAALRSQCQAPPVSTTLGQEVTWGAPILENSNPKESYLYCLRPRRPVTLAHLGSLAQQFATSLDVAQLGQVRGLYVRSQQDEHHLLMVELGGAVDLDRAFSKSGDAPGHDFADLPRPDGRRSASISFNGAPQLNVYQIPEGSDFTLHGYAELLKSQWAGILSPSPALAGSGHSVVARTAHNTYVIVLHPRSPARQAAWLSVTRLLE